MQVQSYIECFGTYKAEQYP